MEKLKSFILPITWIGEYGEHGWGNGYVLLPKGHKYWGVDCEDIPVNVHGGLTFADEIIYMNA